MVYAIVTEGLYEQRNRSSGKYIKALHRVPDIGSRSNQSSCSRMNSLFYFNDLPAMCTINGKINSDLFGANHGSMLSASLDESNRNFNAMFRMQKSQSLLLFAL